MLYSEKARHLAQWLEDHPEIDQELSGTWDYPSVWLGCGEDTEKFGRLCRSLGEFTKNKSSWDNNLSAVVCPETDEYDRLFRVTVNVAGACTKTAKLDENGEVVVKKITRTVPVETIEVEEDEIQYEWVCPESFLSL